MPRPERLKDYRVPATGGLRRRLLWRLRRMRRAVDVETLEVFEHQLAAFERAGVAELERQRTRNVAAASARVADAQAREELIRRAIERTEDDLRRAELDVQRLDAKLTGHDPDFHTYA
jgi:hypothetical protein